VVERRDRDGGDQGRDRPVQQPPGLCHDAAFTDAQLDELVTDVRTRDQQRGEDQRDDQPDDGQHEAEDALREASRPLGAVGQRDRDEDDLHRPGGDPNADQERYGDDRERRALDEADQQRPESAVDHLGRERDGRDLDDAVDELHLPAAAVASDQADDGDGGQQDGRRGQQHPEGELGSQSRDAVADSAVDGADREPHRGPQPARAAFDEAAAEGVHRPRVRPRSAPPPIAGILRRPHADERGSRAPGGFA
jgi:hypothetical protein